MLSTRMTLPLLATLPLVLGGCPLFEAKVDGATVCYTRTLSVDPAAPGETTLTRTYVEDSLGDLQELVDSFDEADVEVVSVSLTASGAVASFGFIDSVAIALSDPTPASDLPRQTVASCDGASCDVSGAELHFRSSADALQYVEAGSMQVDLVVAGALPVQAWSVDVEICMNAELAVGL